LEASSVERGVRGDLMDGEKALVELRRSDATKNFIVVFV
jgi:hypothetical protein